MTKEHDAVWEKVKENCRRFREQLPELVKGKHAGRWALIQDGEVYDSYDDEDDAYCAGVGLYGARGGFAIMHVSEEMNRPLNTWELGVGGALIEAEAHRETFEELEEAKKELERLRAMIAGDVEQKRLYYGEREELEQLRRMASYAKHQVGCRIYPPYEDDCSCGLDALKKGDRSPPNPNPVRYWWASICSAHRTSDIDECSTCRAGSWELRPESVKR